MTTFEVKAKAFSPRKYANLHMELAHGMCGAHPIEILLSVNGDALYLKIDGRIEQVLPIAGLIQSWVFAVVAADGVDVDATAPAPADS